MSTPAYLDDLRAAAARAKATLIGIDRVTHFGHALLVATALRAFGDDPRAVVCVETLPPAANVPRPDLILLHPDVGILVVENKGVSIDDVRRVEGTSMSILRDGRLTDEDPFIQAERVMYRLRDLATARADARDMLFLRMVALPRIGEAAFNERFGVRWSFETLFREAFDNPADFRLLVVGHADHEARKAGKRSRLSSRAHDVILEVLRGQVALSPIRKTVVEHDDDRLLGARIQREELRLRQHTPQQRELCKADFRGQHRLFRGVAGSGKTIMLASAAARMLYRMQEDASPGLFNAADSRPPPKMLVACYNRALVPYLRQKIEDEYARLAWTSLADTKLIAVWHFEKLVRYLERVEPTLRTRLDHTAKAERAALLLERFDALPEPRRLELAYDAVLLDEAQDLQPEEIRFLLRLARPDAHGRQTFLVFYDNAQNIYNARPPTWEHLGVNIKGGRTTFMDTCLRNTRQTLLLAFNVLVGAFAPEGMRVGTRTFADVASLRQRGLITETGGVFDVHFAPRDGPFPTLRRFATRKEEVAHVCDEIKRLIRRERVLPSDILVLCRSHKPFKTLLVQLGMLVAPDYGVRLVGPLQSRAKDAALISDNVLTVSTLASAKGYDAPIVFLIGADDIADDTVGRAHFYVAATRAKHQLHVTGLITETRSLLDEVEQTAAALTESIGLPPRGD